MYSTYEIFLLMICNMAISTVVNLKNKPTQKNLDHISKKAGNNWRSLLTQLGEDDATIEGFRLDASGNTTEACFKGLVHWWKGNADEPVTWGTLLKALRDADMKGCADELEKGPERMSQTESSEQAPQLPSLDMPASDRSGSDTPDQRNEGAKSLEIGTEAEVTTPIKRSKKDIESIVQMYRKGKTELSLPSNPELENEYDDILGSVRVDLSEAGHKVHLRIHTKVCSMHNRLIHGVAHTPLPQVAETGEGLYKFIAENSTPYEIFLVERAIDELSDEKLMKAFSDYKPKLRLSLEEKLTSYQQRKFTIPRRADHTHLAVVVSKDQVLLSLMLYLKEYFVKCIGLQECLFEGFQEGCSVFYFAITTADAVFLAPKILSHLGELKRRFSITHVVVFSHFAVDIDQGSVELLEQQKHIGELTSLLEKEEEMTKLKETLEQAESRLALLEHEQEQTRQHEAMRMEPWIIRRSPSWWDSQIPRSPIPGVPDDPLKLSSVTETETEKEYMRESYDDPLMLSKEDTERKLKSADINGGHFVRTSDPFSKSLALSVWDKQNKKCVHFEVDVRQTKHPEYSIDKKDYFASMEELYEHYQWTNLPGCDFKLCSTY